jgi:hypothetical protein
MMICEQARLQIGAAPDENSAELDAHLTGCAECRAFHVASRALNEHIRRAMQLPPPGVSLVAGPQVGIGAPMAGRPLARKASGVRRGWALAASVLLAALAVLLLWPAQSGTALASDLVQHLSEGHAGSSWDNTEVVPEGVLDQVLRESGVEIRADAASPIVYAHSCEMRGRLVPHLVMRTSVGPLTVVPLVGEALATTERFSEGGFSGVLVPQPGGAVAVLARGDADLQAVANAIGARIQLTP